MLRRRAAVGGKEAAGAGDRKPYRSDLSDEQWALIEPVIALWRARHRSVSGTRLGLGYGRIVNAIPYQERTGCGWEQLQYDLRPRSAVYYYFARWRDDGLT